MADDNEKQSTGGILGIALDKGYDTETGVWGYGYSPDNGQHFYVLNTIKGRKYRQEDADRLWKYLAPKIKNLIGETLKEKTDKEG